MNGIKNMVFWEQVLIDTWWNVNVFAGSSCVISRHRFNRYMVECESVQEIFYFTCEKSFNRYMVECEFQVYLLRVMIVNCFNRYMVECELLSEFVNFYGNYCFNRYMVECES